jgi:hypothetical protein
MTFKKFFYSSVIISICTITAIVLFNIYMNEYGLFGNAKGMSINIWNNERTSMYLLSFNYIPANFEGILIGPSFSDNLDTKKISGFKIYNASIDGGNITELKYIAENIIQRGNLKFIIICLSPYMTKNNGMKTSDISPQKYWGALGSKEMLYRYLYKLFTMLGLRYDIYNDYGHMNFNLWLEKQEIAKSELVTQSRPERNSDKMKKNNDNDIEFIDKIAYNELSEILILSRKKGVKIFGYYYPYYIERYNEKRFKTYKERIDKLFDEKDVIWNLNDDKHMAFRSDPSNYYDRTHLSVKGTNYVLSEINNQLSLFYRRNSKVTL